MLLLGLGILRAQEPADSLPQRDEAAAEPARMTGDVPADELWDRANTAYINGDYRGAAEIYGEILDRGLGSVKLYYNLANACFKETPLLMAARAGNNEVVRLLVERHAEVNAADNLQHTALYYAGERGFTEIVELLLSAGAEG